MLISFLRTFSHFNKEIAYCQGMNYLAGYIYLMIMDEELAYKAFNNLMVNRMKLVFINSFDNLKQLFYSIDKLMQIFLPALSEHFKELKIDTHYFATSWFITLFTQCTQFTSDSFVLDCVWDIFLVHNWKGFFKFLIYILKFYEKKLLGQDFDYILNFMSEFMRSDLF